MKRWSVLLVFVAGCASSETVYLANANGQKVQCGPYRGYGSLPMQARQAQISLRDCVDDYQRQGYNRVPGP